MNNSQPIKDAINVYETSSECQAAILVFLNFRLLKIENVNSKITVLVEEPQCKAAIYLNDHKNGKLIIPDDVLQDSASFLMELIK